MAQNNSLLDWKISNYSRGRPNLRNDMNQVTNLKPLGFTWKRIVNLVGVFPNFVLCDIDFRGFFDVTFDPYISSMVLFMVDCVAKLVLFVTLAEADDSQKPTLRSSVLSPLLPWEPLVQGNGFSNYCETDGCWFSSISPFAMFIKSINDCTISFRAFSLFVIQE